VRPRGRQPLELEKAARTFPPPESRKFTSRRIQGKLTPAAAHG
jgi:hypothetical protein